LGTGAKGLIPHAFGCHHNYDSDRSTVHHYWQGTFEHVLLLDAPPDGATSHALSAILGDERTATNSSGDLFPLTSWRIIVMVGEIHI
jgi:hypothetical protein